MQFYLDAGNTRIKWCVTKSAQTLFSGVFESDEYQLYSKLEAIRSQCSITQFEYLAMSSVRSLAFEQAVVNWADEQTEEIFIPRVSDCWADLVEPAYSEPENLGVDRWLAMIAASKRFPDGCMVVSAGTAITVDYVVSAKHVGGLIIPGVRLWFESLDSNTNRVKPKFEGESLKVPQIWGPACDTLQCVQNGASALISGLVVEASQKSRELAIESLCLAGGDAELMKEKFEAQNITVFIDHSLVLNGLRAWVESRKKQF